MINTEIENILKKKGVKPTSNRLLVMKELLKATHPLSHVNLVFVRYFDVLYVVFPLVVLCERRVHNTSPLFGPRGRHWEVVSR